MQGSTFFARLSSWFFSEPEYNAKCYFTEFVRPAKFSADNSTLSVANSKTFVGIFEYYGNINPNLHRLWNIEINVQNSTTGRQDMDVVMQESLELGVSNQLGSTSLVDVILTLAETQMDTWKPDGTNILQLFQDFDDGFDVSKPFI